MHSAPRQVLHVPLWVFWVRASDTCQKKIWVLPSHPTISIAAKDGAGTQCSGGSLGKAPAGTVPPGPLAGRGPCTAAPPAQVGRAPVSVGVGEPPGRARLELVLCQS